MRAEKLSELADKLPNRAQFICHCVSGPVYACEKHKNGIVNLMAFMGAHTGVELYNGNEPCSNCVNELKR
jgi:hypothetical protein